MDFDSTRFKFDSCVFLSTNQNALNRKTANEFALFCTDNRLRQIAIFTNFFKMGKGCARLFFIEKNKLLYDLPLYYIKQIDSMLSCVCFSTRS